MLDVPGHQINATSSTFDPYLVMPELHPMVSITERQTTFIQTYYELNIVYRSFSMVTFKTMAITSNFSRMF